MTRTLIAVVVVVAGTAALAGCGSGSVRHATSHSPLLAASGACAGAFGPPAVPGPHHGRSSASEYAQISAATAMLATHLHALGSSTPSIQRLAGDYARLAVAYHTARAATRSTAGSLPPALSAAIQRTLADALRARVPSCAPPLTTPQPAKTA